MNDFNSIHKFGLEWETTEYNFTPGYGAYDSIYNTSYEERYKISDFAEGTFDVTDELVDKGSETLPEFVTEVLDYFGIAYPKTGSRYDVGPYEKGIDSWIPKSRNGGGIPSGDTSSSSFGPLPPTPPNPNSSNSHSIIFALSIICIAVVFSYF